MDWLYNLFIQGYGTGIRLASTNNEKARKWLHGRKDWRKKLKEQLPEHADVVWFHAASLGEAEQGLPIIQALKRKYPHYHTLLTFFSPSGFEHFKGDPSVDQVFYLPLDTPGQARDFVRIANPRAAVFIKYEIWLNYLKALDQENISVILAPALFREDQFYFKSPFKGLFLPYLKKLHRILVQNQNSYDLLKKQGFDNVEVCGDTRIDRVLEIVKTPFEDDLVAEFCGDHTVLIAGSSWAPEENILAEVLPQFPKLKLILVPHDISPSHLENISRNFGTTNCEWYTSGTLQGNRQVLVINAIGKLSRLYRYGHIAVVGGGFGKGLHSTVEAAAYGMPVLFGPRHRNFVEPGEMIAHGCGFEIHDAGDLQKTLNELLSNMDNIRSVSDKARGYIHSRAGAVNRIFSVLEEVILSS